MIGWGPSRVIVRPSNEAVGHYELVLSFERERERENKVLVKLGSWAANSGHYCPIITSSTSEISNACTNTI